MCAFLTWVQSTCRDWPGIRWRRRRGSWRWCTRSRGQTARGGGDEASRCTAWRGGWRRPAGPPWQEATCCLYPAGERERTTTSTTGTDFHSQHFNTSGSFPTDLDEHVQITEVLKWEKQGQSCIKTQQIKSISEETFEWCWINVICLPKLVRPS